MKKKRKTLVRERRKRLMRESGKKKTLSEKKGGPEESSDFLRRPAPTSSKDAVERRDVCRVVFGRFSGQFSLSVAMNVVKKIAVDLASFVTQNHFLSIRSRYEVLPFAPLEAWTARRFEFLESVCI